MEIVKPKEFKISEICEAFYFIEDMLDRNSNIDEYDFPNIFKKTHKNMYSDYFDYFVEFLKRIFFIKEIDIEIININKTDKYCYINVFNYLIGIHMNFITMLFEKIKSNKNLINKKYLDLYNIVIKHLFVQNNELSSEQNINLIIFFYSILYFSNYDIPEIRNITYALSIFNNIEIELLCMTGEHVNIKISMYDDYYSLKDYVINNILCENNNLDSNTASIFTPNYTGYKSISFHHCSNNSRKIYRSTDKDRCLMSYLGIIDRINQPVTIQYLIVDERLKRKIKILFQTFYV